MEALTIRSFVSVLLFTSAINGAKAAPALPTSLVASNYFFTIHSNATSAIWIAPPTWRVMRDTIAPAARGTGIELHAARNELNILEFHFGTDPNLTASRPRLSASLPTPTQVQLQWTSASNHVFRVEQSSNLSGWVVALDQVPSRARRTSHRDSIA